MDCQDCAIAESRNDGENITDSAIYHAKSRKIAESTQNLTAIPPRYFSKTSISLLIFAIFACEVASFSLSISSIALKI
ncbi:hypothetical protein ACWIUD_07150 [Helicobacter sp. 23-1044]